MHNALRHKSYLLRFKAYLLLMVLHVWISAPCSAGGTETAPRLDADQAHSYAEHLWDQQRYRAAADAFERFTFFHADDPRASRALYQAARAYFAAGDDDQTVRVCRQILDQPAMVELAAQAYLLESRAHLNLKDYDQALISLNNAIVQSRDRAIVDEARYRGAWVLLEKLRFDDAANWLAALSPQGQSDYNLAPLMAELQNPELIAHKNPAVAGILAIVPGAGHIYSQRYRDALVAFVLNGLTWWASWEAFDNDQPALGTLIGVVGLNFYVGNFFSAVNAANKFNRRSAEQTVKRLQEKFPLTLQVGFAPRTGGAQVALTFRF